MMRIISLTIALHISFAYGRHVPDDTFVCPENSLNAGWTVVRSWSFDYPSACCRTRIRNWIPVSSRFARQHQSGCLLSHFLLNRQVTILLQPSNCTTRRDCGDRSVDNHPMECCPDHRCGIKLSDGASSCYSPQKWNREADEADQRSSGCEGRGHRKCLSCRSVCNQEEYVDDLRFN